MPDKKPEQFKTEDQLKAEAKARQAAEAKIIASKPKSALVQKRENFWYHYKWHTIASVFAVVLLSFFAKDMFFTPKPDATIVFISADYVDPAAVDTLAKKIEETAPDFNGDKKVLITVDSISMPSDAAKPLDTSGSTSQGDTAPPTPDLTGGQADYANSMKLVAVIASGVDPLDLLDDAAYQYILGRGEGSEDIFATSFPAEQLGVPQFNGMNFYLRSGDQSKEYYKYCEKLMTLLNRS